MGRSHRGACVRTHQEQRRYTEQMMCRVFLPAGLWHIVGFLRRASSRCPLKEEVGSWMLITPLSFSTHDQTASKQDFKMITQMLLLERIMLACGERWALLESCRRHYCSGTPGLGYAFSSRYRLHLRTRKGSFCLCCGFSLVLISFGNLPEEGVP